MRTLCLVKAGGRLIACSLLALSAASAPAWSAEAGAASGAPGSNWDDAKKMPDFFSGMWMTFSGMVEGSAKNNVPYTPAAQKYVDAYKPKRDIPYAEEGCLSPGLPISMHTGPIKFFYAPGTIAIYMEAVGDTRFIRMNQPQGLTSPKFYGNSVGHWEGDTLVIETKDFAREITFQYGVGKPLPPEETVGTVGLEPIPPAAGAPGPGGPGPGGPGGPGGPSLGAGGGLASLSAAIWGPHGEDMHMVERIRLANPQTLEIAMTIYDDTVWTRPYVTTTRTFRRIEKGKSELGPFTGEPEEWMCNVSITSFDPDTNSYNDKDPEEMVKYLDKLGK